MPSAFSGVRPLNMNKPATVSQGIRPFGYDVYRRTVNSADPNNPIHNEQSWATLTPDQQRRFLLDNGDGRVMFDDRGNFGQESPFDPRWQNNPDAGPGSIDPNTGLYSGDLHDFNMGPYQEGPDLRMLALFAAMAGGGALGLFDGIGGAAAAGGADAASLAGGALEGAAGGAGVGAAGAGAGSGAFDIGAWLAANPAVAGASGATTPLATMPSIAGGAATAAGATGLGSLGSLATTAGRGILNGVFGGGGDAGGGQGSGSGRGGNGLLDLILAGGGAALGNRTQNNYEREINRLIDLGTGGVSLEDRQRSRDRLDRILNGDEDIFASMPGLQDIQDRTMADLARRGSAGRIPGGDADPMNAAVMREFSQYNTELLSRLRNQEIAREMQIGGYNINPAEMAGRGLAGLAYANQSQQGLDQGIISQIGRLLGSTGQPGSGAGSILDILGSIFNGGGSGGGDGGGYEDGGEEDFNIDDWLNNNPSWEGV